MVDSDALAEALVTLGDEKDLDEDENEGEDGHVERLLVTWRISSLILSLWSPAMGVGLYSGMLFVSEVGLYSTLGV